MIYYRSDITDVITGRVLDLMYETSREAFVFKYLDLNSNEIEFIAVEDLSTCDWDHTKGMTTFVSSLSIYRS